MPSVRGESSVERSPGPGEMAVEAGGRGASAIGGASPPRSSADAATLRSQHSDQRGWGASGIIEAQS